MTLVKLHILSFALDLVPGQYSMEEVLFFAGAVWLEHIDGVAQGGVNCSTKERPGITTIPAI